MRCAALSLSPWTIRPPKALQKGSTGYVQPRTVRWGSYCSRPSGETVFEKPVKPHVEGETRSSNRCNAKGLPNGFARENNEPHKLPE